MIKKSIAYILIFLIFINSIGCTSYKQIRMDDKEKIEKAREIRLTTVTNKEYILRNFIMTDSTISFNQWVQNKYSWRRIEIPTDQILYIEVEEVDADSIIWLVLGTVGLLALYGLNNTLTVN